MGFWDVSSDLHLRALSRFTIAVVIQNQVVYNPLIVEVRGSDYQVDKLMVRYCFTSERQVQSSKC